MRLWDVGKDNASLCDLTTVLAIDRALGITLINGVVQLCIAFIEVNGPLPPFALLVTSIPGSPTY